MMNKLFISFVFIHFCLAVFSQNEKLEQVLAKLSEIKSYSCLNSHSSDFPFPLVYEAQTTFALTSEEFNDSAFCYVFDYLPTVENKDQTSDFSLYNGNEVISMYDGEVRRTSRADKPEAFKAHETDGPFGKMTSPAKHKSPSFYNYLIPQLCASLQELKDELQIKPDTLINGTPHFHFHYQEEMEIPGNKTSAVTQDYYFNANNYLPALCTRNANSIMGQQNIRIEYSNFELINNVSLTTFNEDLYIDKQRVVNVSKRKTSDSFINTQAIDWHLKSVANDSLVSLSQFAGKTVVMEFTATWCGHCWEAALAMNELHEKLKNDENIVLLSIFSSNVDKKNLVENFVKKLEIKNTVLYDAEEVGEKYEVRNYPAFFILDKTGRIVKHYYGYSKNIEKKVVDILNEIK